VPADAKAASKLAVSASPQAAAGCCSSTSTSSSSECAVAVIEQVMQWLAHGSSDNSQQEGGGSQGTTHLGVLPDSSCALLLTAFDLVQQQPQQQPQQQQQQQQEQLAAGLVCLLQDSKTQLAGLRCCHWLLVGSSSSSASWAAAWCWRHCGCLVRILQGHSPLLQAWVSGGRGVGVCLCIGWLRLALLGAGHQRIMPVLPGAAGHMLHSW
jgi:hypothetical protein